MHCMNGMSPKQIPVYILMSLTNIFVFLHLSHDLFWLIFNRFMRKMYIYVMIFAWSLVGSLEKCASKSWSSLPYLQKVHGENALQCHHLLCLIISRFTGKNCIDVLIFCTLFSVGSLQKCVSKSWSLPYLQKVRGEKYASMSWSSWPYLQ